MHWVLDSRFVRDDRCTWSASETGLMLSRRIELIPELPTTSSDGASIMSPVFFGTLREHYIILFGIAGSFAALVGFVAAWAGAQFGARRAARQAVQEILATSNVGLDRNIAALTQAVDAIALEVERLSEGQRFTARLLSERPAMSVSTKQEPGRVITPH
jgi:hypothetical protein